MTCDFTSFLTVFQSYQGNVKVIMQGCVQWNLVYDWKEFRFKRGARYKNKSKSIVLPGGHKTT